MLPKWEDSCCRLCPAWTVFKVCCKTIWLKLKTLLVAKAARVRPTHSHKSNKLCRGSSWDAGSWHLSPISMSSYLELTESSICFDEQWTFTILLATRRVWCSIWHTVILFSPFALSALTVLGMEPKVSWVPGKNSTNEYTSRPQLISTISLALEMRVVEVRDIK